MNLLESMQKRHAVRDYNDEPLTAEQVNTLDEAIAAANAKQGLDIQLIHDVDDAFGGCPTHYGRFKNVHNLIALIGTDSPSNEAILDEKVGHAGQLLALTAADFDFEKETVRINKSYQRLHGEDVITTPKTKKSNRIIKMPKFLCEEMQEYLQMLYGLKKKDRIFAVTKSYLHHEMDRGAKAAGVKRIRIHDLRHSHISLLIDMGFSAVAIADRVGHESIDITYQYAHLIPSKQTEMADRLDDLGKGEIENVS